jgi:hypothetical protein
LTHGNFVSRVILQTGVVDDRNLWVMAQELCNLACLLRLRPNPPGQSADSSPNQPAVEGRGYRSARSLNQPNPLEQIVLLPADERSTHHVAVTA